MNMLLDLFAPTNASLVSPAMPPAQHQRSLRQSHTDSAQLTHDHGVDCSPSARQFTAIDILQQLDNETILAWLTGLRTFRPGSDHWFQPSKLKPQHLNAISSLKEWSDDLVLAWLDSARRTG